MSNEVFDKVIEIASPFIKNKETLSGVNSQTSFLKDLQISSSRLVDIVLAIEDEFAIEIADNEADRITTVGAAVDLIQNKISAH